MALASTRSGPRAMRTRFYTPADTFHPIATINTTPLIDMMLVLLIMFIVAIPLSTHKVPLDLPSGPPPERAVPPPVHRLDIDAAGRLRWDGRPIAAAALGPLLARLAADPAGPELHLRADGEARYERVDQVLAEIQRAGVARMGFLDNQRFAETLDN